jgi:hypothetical protein
MSETTLRFLDSDEAIAFTRRTGPGGGNAWIGTSQKPYTEWSWQTTDRPVGGPNFIVLPNGELWATSSSS